MTLRFLYWTSVIGLTLALGGTMVDCTDRNRSRDGASASSPKASPNAHAIEAVKGPAAKPLHEKLFEVLGLSEYEGTAGSCLICHSDHGQDILKTAHWKWKGTVTNIAGLEGATHGKVDLINNFCIGVPSNEEYCAMCHPSYGWKAGTADSFFADAGNTDCLICHDTTGTYRKHPTANGGGGAAALLVDGKTVPAKPADLTAVAYNVGTPSRANCGLCHFYAGAGDNVKHGDLSSDLINPTKDDDVHMGGLDFNCQECHSASHHKIAGTTELHSDEGQATCMECHSETETHTENGLVALLLNQHTKRIACQTCHIPTFSRSQATKVAWYRDEAGEDRTEIAKQFGKSTYSKKAGRSVWAKNVRPTYLWYNGKSKIYPFKKMIGRQPTDITNKRLLVPHIYGTGAGPNLYLAKFDWGQAVAEGTAYARQPYSGDYSFINTVAYLRINHEVAPKENALRCEDCHGVEGFFEALGYDKDPFGD